MKSKCKFTRRTISASLIGVMGLVAAACGSSSAASSTSTTSISSSSSASPTTKALTPETVNVGVLPIADVAPLYLGMKQGFFAKQKLTIVPHQLQGGAAVASAVVGGTLQFGFGATANLILAKAHNLPLQFVASGDSAAATASQAWSAIQVSAGSGITAISQLVGKTIATNATQGENELALDSILLKNGVNPSSVHVIAMPFPNMPSALSGGQVQAVTEVEPFVSAIAASGGKTLSPLFEGMQPSLLVAGYFTTASEISNHPGLVKRFVTAMNESLSYAQQNPDAVRSIIPTYTKIPSKVASKLTLPIWDATLDTSSIKTQESLMEKLGWITSEIPISQLVWSGAKQ